MKKIKLFTLLLIITYVLMTNVFASSNNKNIINNNNINEYPFEGLNLPRLADFPDIDENDFIPGELYDFDSTHEENVESYTQILNTNNVM